MDDSERMSDAAVRVCVEVARDLRDLWKRQCERSPDMDVSAQAVVYDRVARFGEEVLALRADILRAEHHEALAHARAERTATRIAEMRGALGADADEDALDAARRVVREREEARAEVERLRAAIDAALVILHTLPPPECAAHWYLRLTEGLAAAIRARGGAL
jgi:hypothetical protein